MQRQSGGWLRRPLHLHGHLLGGLPAVPWWGLHGLHHGVPRAPLRLQGPAAVVPLAERSPGLPPERPGGLDLREGARSEVPRQASRRLHLGVLCLRDIGLCGEARARGWCQPPGPDRLHGAGQPGRAPLHACDVGHDSLRAARAHDRLLHRPALHGRRRGEHRCGRRRALLQDGRRGGLLHGPALCGSHGGAGIAGHRALPGALLQRGGPVRA
mmetsp:Transcript_159962/g.489327  ORF Transcript_159962/g.489327 Transcript_159962/m.489327 type:complete len:213 (-) Transcript_159962:48-686(-)